MRLTLRTLLAYIDDTLPPSEAAIIGRKVAENDQARELIEKIRKVSRTRGLATPSNADDGSVTDPNTVAEYLSDSLPPESVAEFETACLENDVNLAEVAASHQILTLLLSDPARVPPTARMRMYELVKGPESLPNRKSTDVIPVGGMPVKAVTEEITDRDAGLLLGLTSKGSQSLRWGLAGMLLLFCVLGFWSAWPKNVPTTPSVKSTEPSHQEPMEPETKR